MRFRHSLCIIIAAAVAATTSCGDSGQSTTTPAIDISKLDSGNYPTTPRDMDSTRTADSGPELEAVRIGNATPLPVDIDPKYEFQRYVSYDGRTTPKSPANIYSLEQNEIGDLSQGLIAGWETNGDRRTVPGLGREVVMDILRFSNSDQAETAAHRIADRQAEALPGETVAIPGYPKAHAKWSLSKKYLDSLLVHDTMLLYVHIDDPVSEPPDTTPLTAFTRAAFDKQLEMLKDYSPTPVDKLGSLPLDVDGLLGRTLPIEERQKRSDGSDPSMVLSKQGALHAEHYPALAKAAFEDAGVDLVATASERVYRARDANSAARLIAALVDQYADGYKSIDSPPNMPGVKCFDTKDKKINSDHYPPACYLTYDRYVARVRGTNVQEAYQKAAAQYKLLAYGH